MWFDVSYVRVLDSPSQQHNAITASDIFASVTVPAEWSTQAVCELSGAEMSLASIFALRDIILAGIPPPPVLDLRSDDPLDTESQGFVVALGTDSMVEVAYLLDRLLHSHLSVPVILTGAMKPSDVAGHDGPANVQSAALAALTPECASLGVLVVENQTIHCARYVQKTDSQLIGGFRSFPGPAGFVRRNRVQLAYTSVPAYPFSVPPSTTWEMLDKSRIVIWTMAVSAYLPEIMMADLDGLVIAGQGTGSISQSLLDMLCNYVDTIPIILTTDCAIGSNYDDVYYRGSLDKYESLGLKVADYEGLTPLQARLELMLRQSLRV